MTIDKTKRYETRDGRPVEIYRVDAGGPYPVHGAVWEGSYWNSQIWCSDGRSLQSKETAFDLVEKREKVMVNVWLNIYPGGLAYPHADRQVADDSAMRHRIACINLQREVQHREGL